MKKLILITYLTTLSLLSYSQTLQVGVYSDVTLYTDSFVGYPVTGCWGYEYDFSLNFSSTYVTGMEIVLKIDSLKGPVDSIKIYRTPDLIGSYFKANDTIPLSNNLHTIYIYFLGHDTLYTSLIAYGTPQIANEHYYCNYSRSFFQWAYGCSNFGSQFSGGNGPMDYNRDCFVLLNSNILNDKKQISIEVFPNPANGELNLVIEEKATLEIINSQGQIVETKSLTEKSNNLDLSNLVSGVYTLRIKTDRGIAVRKLIKQ